MECPRQKRYILWGASLALLSGCASHQPSLPALPAERTSWENSPLVAVVPPPEELAWKSPGPAVSEEDWDAYRQVLPVTKRPTKKQPPDHVSQSTGIIKHYQYATGAIYTIPVSEHSPSVLILPAGERLVKAPALDPDLFESSLTQQTGAALPTEVLLLRAKQPAFQAYTGLFLQSGLIIFCRLLPQTAPSMVAVTWDVPAPAPRQPQDNPALRPPVVDMGRLYTQYRIAVQGQARPSWVPEKVFDDGGKTYIRFKEALTYTRAPGVFGLGERGNQELVQSHMYTIPGQPERGAWLIVNGLWPSLVLKDSQKLQVNIVRGP